MLFENVWAARFTDALRNANAELILNERIPRTVIEEALAAALVEALEEEMDDEELMEALEEAELLDRSRRRRRGPPGRSCGPWRSRRRRGW